MYEVLLLQFGVGVEKVVGGYQIYLGVVILVSQQCLQYVGGGGFVDCYIVGYIDDEWYWLVWVLLGFVEKFCGGCEQLLVGGDLQVNQLGQWQVDFFDF